MPLFIILAAILWGLDGVLLTPQLAGLDIVFIVFVLHALPFVLMSGGLKVLLPKLKTISPKDWIIFFCIALLGGSIGTIFLVKALISVHFAPLSIIILLQKLQPVFAIVLARIFLREHLSRYFVVWSVVALLASYTLCFGFGAPQVFSDTAVVYSILAACAFGAATVLGRKISPHSPPALTTYTRYGLTTLITGLWMLSIGTHTQWSQVTQTQWIVFGIIALTTGTTAIYLYYKGLQKTQAHIATICELAMPITVMIADFWVHKTVLSPIQWVSAAVMIAAITQIVQKR